MGKYILRIRKRTFATKDKFVILTDRELKSIKGGCRIVRIL